MKRDSFLFGSSWKFKFAMFFKLPSVFFWGIKLIEITSKKAIVSIPYSWMTQNPFKSIYFAAQAGAGELSTGMLIMKLLKGRKDISMLVIKSKMEFHKKASNKVRFICEDGDLINESISKLINPGDVSTVLVKTIGYNHENEIVSNMELEWSFRKRE